METTKKVTLLSNTELSGFFQQLSLILNSGISPYEGITIMWEDIDNPQGKALLLSIREQLELGSSLHSALKESGVFPAYALQMINIGEYTGTLDQVTASLADYYAREAQIQSEIKSAVTYPIIMIGIMIIIVGVLVVKVLPIFNQVYQQLGSEMTGISGNLLNLGYALEHYGLPAAAVLVLLLAVYALLVKRGRIKLPFSRVLYEDIAAFRFAAGLSLTLGSGLDANTGLSMLDELTEYEPMKDKIKACREMTENGTELTEALQNTGIFTGLYARLVSMGYRTGNTDKVMAQVAGKYQERVNERTRRLVGLLEPTLVAVLSILVGIILLSVMLPLLGVLTGMNL